MKKSNKDIRDAIKEAHVLYWQVAQMIGVTDGMFSRMLRTELPDEKKSIILNAIKTIKEMEV